MGSSRILQISEGILQGLRALHRRKKPIIHGALSPRNILMDEFDHVSLTYPGFALGDGSIDPFALEAGPFAYRAPEASLGDAATARSDVFSFGCVLWFMLCGQPPAGGSVLRAIYTHAEGQQVLPNPTELHPRAKDLLSLATHCLNKDQARRPRSTGTVVRALNVIFES